MSIAFVNAATGSDFSGASQSGLDAAAANHTTGNLLVVNMRPYAPLGQTVTSVTDTAGNTYSHVASASGSDFGVEDVWYAKNITGNAANVVRANFSAPVSYVGINVCQYSGCDPTSPLDVTATGSSLAGSVTSGAFTTTQADELIVANAEVGGAFGSTWGVSGFTIRVQDSQQVSIMADKIVSAIQTAATVTATVSTAGANCIVVATFKALVAPTFQPAWARGSNQVIGGGGYVS